MEIHGIVLTRNDWGLLAVAISNAFLHVEVIHVINHGSDDQTAHGLEILKEIWNERLKIYSTGSDVPYEQSLLTNMVASFAEIEGADWIYVFDSDEFLISKPGFSLKDELSKLNNEIVAVKYGLTNYISLFDFDKNNLQSYEKLIYKSIPTNNYNRKEAQNLVYKGELSFFDIPFPSKIIFRAKQNLIIGNGAHFTLWLPSNRSVVNFSMIDCAHLSFISRDILERKSQQGQYLIKMTRPGWHLKLVYQLKLEGRLDWFWERHSIKKESDDTHNPRHTIDHAFAESIASPISVLREKFGGIDLLRPSNKMLNSGKSLETEFTFTSAFQLSKFFNDRIKLLIPKQPSHS